MALDLIWYSRTGDIPDALWAECFAPPHEGLFWFAALEAAGIADQFTFFFGLLRDGGVPVGIVPAFLFDLPLELVLPDALAPVLAIAARSPFRKLTRVRTFFLGNVAGEEGRIGLARSHRLAEVAKFIEEAALAQAAKARAALLVWKDFGDGDREALDPLRATGAFRIPSYPGSTIPLLPGGYAAYLKMMRSQHRNKMKRKLTRGEAILPLTSTAVRHPSAAQIRDIYALYAQTYRRGKTKFERLTPEFFTEIAKFERATFMVQRHRDTGRVLAFMLLFDLGERVINQFIGIDYEATQGGYPYFQLFAAAYDWACTATAAQVMQSGQTGYMAKLECGHTLVPLWNYSRHRNPMLNWLFRRVSQRISWGTLDPELNEWLVAHPDAVPGV